MDLLLTVLDAPQANISTMELAITTVQEIVYSALMETAAKLVLKVLSTITELVEDVLCLALTVAQPILPNVPLVLLVFP